MTASALRMSHIPPLGHVYFYLTEGCNLACRHCWLAPRYDPQGKRSTFLPVDLFEKVVREARPLGLTTVKLTGGEPLMHPAIETLLDIVKREALNLAVETNGQLCTPELAGKLAAIPNTSVSVSMDGADAAVYERIRGVKGSFAAATQAVRNLAACGLAPQMIFSIMRENANQVAAIIELGESLGASSIKFNVIQPMARGGELHQKDMALDVAEYIEIGRQVNQELAPKTPLRLHFDYPVAFHPLHTLAENNGCDTCGILGIIGVLATGHYALCGIGELMDGLVFGNAASDCLADVWQRNQVLNRLRDGLPARLRGICSRCLMAGRCLGACVAQNVYHAQDLFAPFWFCEEAEQQGLFPKSRLKESIL